MFASRIQDATPAERSGAVLCPTGRIFASDCDVPNGNSASVFPAFRPAHCSAKATPATLSATAASNGLIGGLPAFRARGSQTVVASIRTKTETICRQPVKRFIACMERSTTMQPG